MSALRRRIRSAVSPRVVLDTNLVLSALVFRGGASAALRQAWQQGACVPLVSVITLTELIRALSYPKFRLRPEEQHELLADYLPYAQTIPLRNPIPALPRCRDPHDLPFLHLAIAGQAEALVSGDKDLLVLAGEFSIPIFSLSQFLDLLRGEPH